MRLSEGEMLVMDELWRAYLSQPGASPDDGVRFTERFYAWVKMKRAEKALLLGESDAA